MFQVEIWFETKCRNLHSSRTQTTIFWSCIRSQEKKTGNDKNVLQHVHKKEQLWVYLWTIWQIDFVIKVREMAERKNVSRFKDVHSTNKILSFYVSVYSFRQKSSRSLCMISSFRCIFFCQWSTTTSILPSSFFLVVQSKHWILSWL